mmetsp:Transcript_130690/g.279462  ORF Transcript_130690/g.279462 Transcript_130690/m.279462 type:complete len:273 (-) Transcript_130690:572-1390(-)
MRSSAGSVSTPSDVATSSACSKAEATALVGAQLMPSLSTSLSSPCDPSRLLQLSPMVSPAPLSSRRSSSIAAASLRSAAMRSLSSLSSASRAADLAGSEAQEASCSRKRSRSSLASARTSSSGSSTSPPSASRAVAAASEPHQGANGGASLPASLQPLSSGSAAAVVSTVTSGSATCARAGGAPAAPPGTSAATASLTNSAFERVILSCGPFLSSPSIALATSGATPDGRAGCGSSVMIRTSASWFPASKGLLRVATSYMQTPRAQASAGSP